MAKHVVKIRIRFAWWLWPVLYTCYPLIWCGSHYQPAAVEQAIGRIVQKALRVKMA